jgi:hypothetical protein
MRATDVPQSSAPVPGSLLLSGEAAVSPHLLGLLLGANCNSVISRRW